VFTCHSPQTQADWGENLSEAPCKGARETRFDCTSARASQALLPIRIPEEEFCISAESERANSIPVRVLYNPLMLKGLAGFLLVKQAKSNQ